MKRRAKCGRDERSGRDKRSGRHERSEAMNEADAKNGYLTQVILVDAANAKSIVMGLGCYLVVL